MPNPISVHKREACDFFRRALLRVAPDYFSAALPQNKVAHGERVFAYELYHQLRIQFSTHPFFDQWYVHGEFRKGLSLVPRIRMDETFIPDIVIHEKTDELEGDLIAVEIKTNPRTKATEIIADLGKLEIYTNPEELDFQIGIFVAVNFDVEKTLRRKPGCWNRAGEILRKGPRTAIWNIHVPDADPDADDGQLLETCLRILRADAFLKV